ncbi:MAG: SEL1-like repeat protein [Clostridia bacterium]|nr:SEL1-like repeat protein [Clostridia bacterium]
MKCKKCGTEWATTGESLSCPRCETVAVLSQKEQQFLWEEIKKAEQLQDRALRTECLQTLAAFGNKKAQYLYGEALRTGDGTEKNVTNAVVWYKAAAKQLYAPAAYQLFCCLRDYSFGSSKRLNTFWLRVAAEFGSVDAAYELSRCYESGDGVEVSHRYALFWLTRAAKGGNREAVFKLAKMYATGSGVEKNLPVARELAEGASVRSISEFLFIKKLGKGTKAPIPDIDIPTREEDRFALGLQADQEAEPEIAANMYYLCVRAGNVNANYHLACCYAEGRGVEKDPEEARRRFAIAADEGKSTEAMMKLADYMLHGIGGEVDKEGGVAYYERAADQGEAEAAYLLAQEYHHGENSDMGMAYRWYERASAMHHEKAKQEFAILTEKISILYENAISAQQAEEYEKAIKLYTLAAKLGHANSCYRLAQMFQNGIGTKKNMRSAVHYYKEATKQGHLGAVYCLGVCYFKGDGVVCDYAVANRLLTIAAKQNYGDARTILEEMKRRRHIKTGRKFYSVSTVLYRRGEIVEAIRFRSIAAQLGYARAMFVMGCHYEFGDGVPLDRDRAGAWYTRAAKAGFNGEKGNIKGGFLHARKELLRRQHIT